MNCFRRDFYIAVGRRVAKAKDAADRAVASCNRARIHAESVVDPHNPVHVEGRDAAALAALNASEGCAAASLAALEVAARYEAAAEAAATNDRGDATFAAEQARAAAAGCDTAAATAASRAANAFADICILACADAAAKTLAAREAATRCVRARDDAATAALVAGNAAFREAKVRCVLARYSVIIAALVARRYRDVAHGNASRESADGHKKARRDAAAAAFGAQEVAVRCAAASRRAVSAASVAQEAASRCDAAGGDGAAAAAAARQAAGRCVAARADAAAAGDDVAEVAAVEAVSHAVAGPVVPHADEAASKAREAAASCDKAIAAPVAEADKEFVDKMGGWLMTVATLFVGIAFQAMVQPPAWMSFDDCYRLTIEAGNAASGAPSPAPAPSPASTADNVTSACSYLYLNTITMAIALTLLVVLLTMKKSMPRITLIYIKGMLTLLTFSIAGTFITGTPGNQRPQLYIFVFFALYTIFSIFFLKTSYKRNLYRVSVSSSV